MATSTTATVGDLINSEIIESVGLDYLRDHQVVDQLVAEYSLENKSSNTLQLWRFITDMGTVGDGGAAVATAFDRAETADIASTTLDSESVTITPAEYGINRTVSDWLFEDNLSGREFVNMVVNDSARVLMAAWENDLCDLFVDFNNSVAAGSTGQLLNLGDMVEAMIIVRNNGVRAPDGGSYVLDQKQADDYEQALIAVGASTAVYASTADKFINAEQTSDTGMANGQIGWFRGQRVFMTGLTDEVNGAADVAGWYGIHDTPANRPYAAIGKAVKRQLRMATDRDESARITEFISTFRYGAAELQEFSGVPIETVK